MAAKPKKTDLAEAPDVERHDEVYFRHPAGPKVGRVLARGEAGCVIEADGERHKVRWENFLGHKVRVRPDVKVVSHGEDGILVEAPHGGRRFVRDPLGVVEPAAEPEPIRKSLRPIVLLFTTPDVLAKAMTGRPGLTLQDVTTGSGARSKRRKKTSQDSPRRTDSTQVKSPPSASVSPPGTPAAKRHAKGAQVKFKIGVLEGEGKVVGDPGKDGAHVEDAAGHQHAVLWSQMRDGGDSEPADAPVAGTDGVGRDAGPPIDGPREGSGSVKRPRRKPRGAKVAPTSDA